MADDAPKTPAPAPAAPLKPVPAANVPAPKLVEGVVARGRTVLAATDEVETVAYKDDGTPRYRYKHKEHGPGETVKLPEGEIAHLRRTGFLVDPDLKVADVATGPTLTNVPG